MKLFQLLQFKSLKLKLIACFLAVALVPLLVVGVSAYRVTSRATIDSVANTLQEYEKLKAGELALNFINRYRKNDGSYIYLEWNATPNTLTSKLYCVARDITDRKKIETALKESEEQIQTIFKNAPDAVVVIDEEGRIVRWNPRAETIFGWSAAEVNGKHLHEKRRNGLDNSQQPLFCSTISSVFFTITGL